MQSLVILAVAPALRDKAYEYSLKTCQHHAGLRRRSSSTAESGCGAISSAELCGSAETLWQSLLLNHVFEEKNFRCFAVCTLFQHITDQVSIHRLWVAASSESFTIDIHTGYRVFPAIQ
jgi:hypothetical protein